MLGTGFDATPRWQAVAGNYEEYAVKGLKIHWIPQTNVAVAGAGAAGSVNRFFKVDVLKDIRNAYAMSENAVITAPGFQLKNPYAQYRHFQSCKKISHQ